MISPPIAKFRAFSCSLGSDVNRVAEGIDGFRISSF